MQNYYFQNEARTKLVKSKLPSSSEQSDSFGVRRGGGGDSDVVIDLSSLTFNESFVITTSDLGNIKNTSAQFKIIDKLYERIPQFQLNQQTADPSIKIFTKGNNQITMSRFLGAGTYGSAMLANFNGQEYVLKMIQMDLNSESDDFHTYQTYRKADKEKELARHRRSQIQNVLQEILVHHIMFQTCQNSNVILQKQQQQKMAKVPGIYGMFRCKSNEFLPHSNGTTNNVMSDFICILMEKLDKPLDSALDDIKNNLIQVTTVASLALYQISNLLEALHQTIRYNHRDLKADNMMIKYLRAERSLCGYSHFQTYIIDFGCSRLEYNGHVVSCNPTLYGELPDEMNSFNELRDICYFAWSLRHTIGCKVNTRLRCGIFHQKFDEILMKILNSSGISFDTDEYEFNTGLTAEFYTELNSVGNYQRLNELTNGHAHQPNNIFLTTHIVKLLMKHMIRLLSIECHGRTTGASIHVINRIDSILQSLSESNEEDDEPVVEDLSDD